MEGDRPPPDSETHPRVDDDEIDLLDYAILLANRKKLIVITTVVTGGLACIISLFLPATYVAKTTFFVRTDTAGASMVREIPDVGRGLDQLLGRDNPADLYVALVESRTIRDSIIDRFHLMERYGEEVRDDARKRLADYADAAADAKSGIITLTVEDRDPTVAADMANAIVEGLQELTSGFSLTEAEQRRVFFEEQLYATKENLIRAEEALRAFQEETGAIKMEDQAGTIIRGIGEIKAQIVAKEVQLQVMKLYATEYNPDLIAVKEELNGLQAQMRRLEVKDDTGESEALMPTGNIPAIGTGYIRLLRDREYYETLFEVFARQYELARADEARNTTLIQVIDRAVPPKKKAKPQVALITLVAVFIAFFGSALAGLTLEYIASVSGGSDTARKVQLLWETLQIRSK